MVAMASHLLVELDFAAALSSCKNPSEKYVYSVYMCWYRNKVKIDKALVEIQIQNHDEKIVKISLDKGEVGDDLENRVVVLQEEKVPGHGKKSVSTQLKQQVKDLPPLEFELACPQNKEEKVPRRGKKSVSTQLKQQVKDSPPLEFEGACAQRKVMSVPEDDEDAANTCAVRSRNEWISYNDTRVSVISNQDYNNSPEVQENATIAIYTALMASVLLDKCNSSIPPPYLLKFTELEYTGLTIQLESELKMKGAKPHSRFQLEKCNLMSLMAGEWIDSKIITSYMDLLQDSKLNGQKVFCFDPTFLPVYKDKGYNAVRRHCKVKNIMDYDCLLFPVHTPQHWCLVVVYPQVHEIHCIDSLQQSNYDAINWIWMYLANEMRYAWNIQMLRSDWKYNDATSNHSMQKNSHDCGAFVCFAARLLVEGYPCLHTQEMMGGFRLQMAHELSCGVLYALQSDRSSCVSIAIDDSHSGIQDDTAKHGQSDCDDMEIDQTDQLGDDGDMDDEDDADESDEERTADPNF
eukprot:Em0102g13a